MQLIAGQPIMGSTTATQVPPITMRTRRRRHMRRILRLFGIALFAFATAYALAVPPETLLIGPGDTLRVQVLDTPELEQHPRVTDSGDIPLIGVGNLHVAGLTPAEAAAQIRTRFIHSHFMNHPDVSVTVEQYATQTVSV